MRRSLLRGVLCLGMQAQFNSSWCAGWLSVSPLAPTVEKYLISHISEEDQDRTAAHVL